MVEWVVRGGNLMGKYRKKIFFGAFKNKKNRETSLQNLFNLKDSNLVLVTIILKFQFL
jgi:hypothetical protein